MLLLEDKSIISELNNLSEEEQRKLVISHARAGKITIYFGTIKKNLKDKRNFHILSENGVRLQREELEEFLNSEKTVKWSIVNKDSQERIYGDFGTIIYEFNKLI